jgi:ribosome-binding protein aMBF1 (putative translation factor)
LKSLRSAAARAVATVLAGAREKAGLTQRQLAQRIRRPHSVVGMIETEHRQVTVPEFIALAKAVGADPLKLLDAVLKQC